MAIIPQPDLIVLDEPTTGMDVESRRDFWASMHAETARGRTVLFATHYLEEADAYADRVVLMRTGKIVADGTAAQIKASVSGRTHPGDRPGADLAALAALPGVRNVETRGDVVLLQCADSDDTLRYLLNNTPAHDIEVTSADLEDAVLAISAEQESLRHEPRLPEVRPPPHAAQPAGADLRDPDAAGPVRDLRPDDPEGRRAERYLGDRLRDGEHGDLRFDVGRDEQRWRDRGRARRRLEPDPAAHPAEAAGLRHQQGDPVAAAGDPAAGGRLPRSV